MRCRFDLKFGTVPAAKLVEAVGDVPVPLSKVGGRRYVLHPRGETKFGARHAARPQPVDEHAPARTPRREVVDARNADLDGRGTRLGTRKPCGEPLEFLQVGGGQLLQACGAGRRQSQAYHAMVLVVAFPADESSSIRAVHQPTTL